MGLLNSELPGPVPDSKPFFLIHYLEDVPMDTSPPLTGSRKNQGWERPPKRCLSVSLLLEAFISKIQCFRKKVHIFTSIKLLCMKVYFPGAMATLLPNLI